MKLLSGFTLQFSPELTIQTIYKKNLHRAIICYEVIILLAVLVVTFVLALISLTYVPNGVFYIVVI